jgi:hypothetical protein
VRPLRELCYTFAGMPFKFSAGFSFTDGCARSPIKVE